MGQSHALIHLAWWRQKEVRRLIFAWVEICPGGYPKQRGHPYISEVIPGDKNAAAYVGRFPMLASEVNRWYEDVAAGRLVLPTHPDRKTPGDGKLVETGPLVAEPGDKSECLAMGLPFLPAVHGGVFVRALFGDPDTETQRVVFLPSIIAWLDSNLFFSLEEYPEYLGSIFRMCYNPVIRSVERRLAPREDGNDDELIRINTWPGANVVGCELIAMDQRPFGVSPILRQSITSSTFKLNWPRRIEHTGMAIFHPNIGLCWWNEPLSYIRTVGLNMTPLGPRKVIELRSKDGALKDRYEIQAPLTDGVLSKPSMIGETPNPRAVASRYYSARAAREKRQLSATLGVRWFDHPKEASDVIRSIIHGAREYVWIVDPYFAGEDLVRFGIVAPKYAVVSVLTSAEALRQKVDKGNGAEAGDKLDEFLKQVAQHKLHPNISVHVAQGTQSTLHDRFLVVDGRVWLSGNSLNNIGERASVLIEIPEPTDIVKKLTDLRNDASPFEQWLAERRSKRSHSSFIARLMTKLGIRRVW